MVRFRLVSPREVAARLNVRARREPEAVTAHLVAHPTQWRALVGANPHDAADILEELGEEHAPELLALVDPEEAGPLLEELRTDLAVEILERLGPSETALILEAMASHDAADLLMGMGPEDREPFLAALDVVDKDTADGIRSLLRYPPESAGGLMTTDFAALPEGITAGEALEVIRRIHEEIQELAYVYVVDELDRLTGVISFRDLAFRRPGVGLEEVMVHHPIAVHALADRAEVAELSQRYNLKAVPVVDQRRRLLGVVPTDAVFSAIHHEASEDFAAAFGAGAEESVYSAVPASIRARFPWLVLNLGLAFIVSIAMLQYESVLVRNPVLVVLLPVVALLGGNAGAQSLAVTIRGLAGVGIPRTEVWGIVGRQAAIGAGNGILVGAAAGAVATFYVATIGAGQALGIGLVVAVAGFANLAVATVAGTAIPLTFRAMGRDPALASNIFLTLVTDLVGFAGFLAVAGALL